MKYDLKNTFITPHAKEKMRYYQITHKQVLKILNHPLKVEDSNIVEGAKCYHRSFGKKKEVFVMLKYEKQKPTVISAWTRLKISN
jgi:hypothetical protein